MLTEAHIKEGLSRAFILAVAHRAGFNCSLREFDYGIDGTFRDIKNRDGRLIESGFSIDFQAKASVRCEDDGDAIVYDLEAKAQLDLVDQNVGAPRILILLALPSNDAEWLQVEVDSLRMRRCAWWASLRGQPPTTNEHSQRVRIPQSQVFNVAALVDMMSRVRIGGLP